MGRILQKSHNIIRVLSGLKGPARQNPPSIPLEAWKLLITDDMLGIIVKHTNTKTEMMAANYSTFKRRKNCRSKFTATFICPTDKIEIKA